MGSGGEGKDRVARNVGRQVKLLGKVQVRKLHTNHVLNILPIISRSGCHYSNMRGETVRACHYYCNTI